MKGMDLALKPIGSLEAYLQTVFGIPMLTAEQEHDLAVRYRDEEDLHAARQLVLSHLRFVVHIARGYSGYGLPQADLIQEGNIGLMKAVKRFDPTMNVRLVSFAVHWIRAEIHEFILRNWRLVKVATTKAQRKLFFNLRSSKKSLNWFTQDEIAAVAKDLGVTPQTVREMEKRMNGQDVSFDAHATGDDDDDHVFAPSSYLSAGNADPAAQLEENDWSEHTSGKLQRALATLDDRSRKILELRWLDEDSKPTLQTLADEYQVSAERIRQLEKNAMRKLRTAMEV